MTLPVAFAKPAGAAAAAAAATVTRGCMLETGRLHHPDIDADESILSRAALKWNARIILALDERPHRFLELKREMTGASQRMLTRALRSLQRDGLIDRVEVPDTVLHVSYLITDLGRSAAALVRHNNGWIARHLPAIRAAQLRFDAVDE